MKLPGSKQHGADHDQSRRNFAWRDGKRVGFGTKEYRRQRALDPPRCCPATYLYPEPEPGKPEPGGVPPPPTGLGMAAGDVEELSGLVNSKTRCHHYRLA